MFFCKCFMAFATLPFLGPARSVNHGFIDKCICMRLYRTGWMRLIVRKKRAIPGLMSDSSRFFNGKRILVVEDNPDFLSLLEDTLNSDGFVTEGAFDGREALEKLKGFAFDILLTDLRLPRLDGVELLKRAHRLRPRLPVICFSAYGNIPKAVEVMKCGAEAFLEKPFSHDDLMKAILKILEREERARRGGDINVPRGLSDIMKMMGKGEEMLRVYELVGKVAATDCTILIHGESGTGKQLIAQAVHYMGRRRGKRFVHVSCGALPPTLIENEFFGHEKGAYTGAASRAQGKVMAAEGGTLFLDEIGDIDLALQPKVLRLLEEKKYERLGGTETLSADIRFIAATNRDLVRMVSRGRFREDLYYRLKVISIYLPPLRQRREDIPAIVNHFLIKYEALYKKGVRGITRKALGFLSKHNWPGNVRELENVIERAIVLTDNSRIRIDDIQSQLRETEISHVRVKRETGKLYEVEKKLILEALEKCDWNQSRASELLGITRKVLRTRIARYNLSRPRPG